jgi:hypothetical protein
VLGAAGEVVPGSAAGDDAGGEDAGGDDAGGDDAGGDDAGGEEAGGDDAGGEDFADWLGLAELDGCAEDWDTIGVGARDVLEALDRVGLRNIFGEIRAAADGADEDPVPGLEAGSVAAKPGEVAATPAPACGWR